MLDKKMIINCACHHGSLDHGISIIDGARGDRDRALFPKSCVFCRYGKLAPTLEPVSGEVPRPRMDAERQEDCMQQQLSYCCIE